VPESSRYETIFNANPLGMLILNDEGVILEENQRAKDFLKLDVTGTRFQELLGGKEYLDGLIEIDGNRLFLKTSDLPCAQGDGEAPRKLITLITQEDVRSFGAQQAQAVLEYERAYWQDLFEAAQNGMAVFDSQGKVWEINEAITDMSGYSKDEILSPHFSWANIIAPEDLPLAMERLKDLLQTGRVQKFELTFVHKTGRKAPTLISYNRLSRRPSWECDRMVASIQDITEIKQAQERLEDERLYFNEILESTLAAVALFDSEGRVFYVNSACEDIVGFTPEEIMAPNFNWVVDLTPEEFRQEDLDHIKELLSTGTTQPYEKQFFHKNGSRVWVYIAYRTLTRKNERGEPLMACSIIDITPLKEAQTKLKELVEAQQRTIKELSTPLIPVWPGILAVPMVGSFDSQRVHDLNERLLQEVSNQKPRAVLIDLSGLSHVDTQIVSEIVILIAAVRLLGTKTLISGINPQVAQSLVRLGMNLENIPTYATLAQALRSLVRETTA